MAYIHYGSPCFSPESFDQPPEYTGLEQAQRRFVGF